LNAAALVLPVEGALLVAGQLGRVGGEHQALLHLGQVVVVLGVEEESQRQAVALVEVVDVGFAAQDIEQLPAARAQHDALGYAGGRVRVVEVVADGARQVVILLNISGEEEHGRGAEGLGGQVERLHVHLRIVDGDREHDARVFQERVLLMQKLGLHGLVGVAHLVVVTIGPEHADADEVLLELVGRAHVRARQEAQAAGIDFQALVEGKLHREVGRGGLVFGGRSRCFKLKSHEEKVARCLELREFGAVKERPASQS
jgi:hypothetical protein